MARGRRIRLRCLQSCHSGVDFVASYRIARPPSAFPPGKYFLGFDAAIPSRFVVFVPLNSSQTYGLSADMIYSSDTGGWTFTQRNDFSTYSISYLESTFLNNTMHFPTRYSVIITVDMERKDWRKIKMPRGMTNEHGDVSIGKSQGRLFAWRIKNQGDCQLSI